MSQIPPIPPDPRRPLPLDYASPQPNPARLAAQVSFVAQIAMGFVMSLVVGFAAFGTVLMVRSQVSWVLSVLLGLCWVAAIAVMVRIFWRWPGLLVGVLTAFGMVLLVYGMCAGLP